MARIAVADVAFLFDARAGAQALAPAAAHANSVMPPAL